MATIDSQVFNAGSGGVAGNYSLGDAVELTVGYTPDSPSVSPETFTATSTVTNSAGVVVATSGAPFVVNTPQPSGDTVATTDDGSHVWAENSDTGAVAVFATTA